MIVFDLLSNPTANRINFPNKKSAKLVIFKPFCKTWLNKGKDQVAFETKEKDLKKEGLLEIKTSISKMRIEPIYYF